MRTKEDILKSLQKECLACRKCSIGGQDINGKCSNVFSNMGKSNIIIYGQNPGANEVEQKQPFVGKSGMFFDKAVKEVLGIDRSELYIGNLVRCFTPNNRMPTEEEIKQCSHFIKKEIDLLKPQIVITLGAPALKRLTGLSGIMQIHGKEIRSEEYGVSIFPMLHPSPLNMNSPEKKQIFYDDLRKLKSILFKNEVVKILEEGFGKATTNNSVK